MIDPNIVEIVITTVNGRVETVTIFNENAFKSIGLEVPSDFNSSVVASVGSKGDIQLNFNAKNIIKNRHMLNDAR